MKRRKPRPFGMTAAQVRDYLKLAKAETKQVRFERRVFKSLPAWRQKAIRDAAALRVPVDLGKATT